MKLKMTLDNLFSMLWVLTIPFTSISATNSTNYDLMFIADATTSMSDFIPKIKEVLPQIYDLMQLTEIIERVSVLAFRDYCYDDRLIEWSGWKGIHEAESLIHFLNNLREEYNHINAIPKIAKTALLEALEKIENKTICIIYFDSPPYHVFEGDMRIIGNEIKVQAIIEDRSNWLNVCDALSRNNMMVFPLFNMIRIRDTLPFYTILAEKTGGKCFQINTSQLVQTIIGIILSLGGCEFKYYYSTNIVRMNNDFKPLKFLTNIKYYQIINPMYSKSIIIPLIKQFENKFICATEKLKLDEGYKKLVFSIFSRIITKENAICLTYNTLFKKIWRVLCEQRDDVHLMLLVDQLRVIVNLVDNDIKSILQNFIDDWYFRMKEIQLKINQYNECKLFYVIDSNEHLERNLLMEIEYSCRPSSFQANLKLLKWLRISNERPDTNSGVTYIPVGMIPKDTFKLLSHLICPGIKFQTRQSLIMATICIISGSILENEAKKYLNESKGKWIDLSLPANNTVEFGILMMKVAEIALTYEEKRYFKILIKVGSLKKIMNRNFEVEVGYSSYNTKGIDYKEKCKKCDQWRSITLLKDEACAICLSYDELNWVDKDVNYSHMCECYNCLVHYAIHKYSDFNYKFMCYFCRKDKIAPYVECQKCLNKFVYQRSNPPQNFICAVCDINKFSVGRKRKISLVKYIRKNGAGFLGMFIEDDGFFPDGRNKLSSTTHDERLLIVRNLDPITENDLSNHLFPIRNSSKKVLNVLELQAQVFEAMESPKDWCMLCFKNIIKENLWSICGRKELGCIALSCEPCLLIYYQQILPGKIIQPAQIFCPYCKNIPLLNIVCKYNRILANVINTIDIKAFDSSFKYGWCMYCNRIKPFVRRECGEENDRIENFRCDECTKACNPTTINTKKCPNCGEITNKVFGCNHIYCENIISSLLDQNEFCDTHWCWVCLYKSSEDEVYRHMSIEHGGFYVIEDD